MATKNENLNFLRDSLSDDEFAEVKGLNAVELQAQADAVQDMFADVETHAETDAKPAVETGSEIDGHANAVELQNKELELKESLGKFTASIAENRAQLEIVAKSGDVDAMVKLGSKVRDAEMAIPTLESAIKEIGTEISSVRLYAHAPMVADGIAEFLRGFSPAFCGVGTSLTYKREVVERKTDEGHTVSVEIPKIELTASLPAHALEVAETLRTLEFQFGMEIPELSFQYIKYNDVVDGQKIEKTKPVIRFNPHLDTPKKSAPKGKKQTGRIAEKLVFRIGINGQREDKDVTGQPLKVKTAFMEHASRALKAEHREQKKQYSETWEKLQAELMNSGNAIFEFVDEN